MEQAQVPENPCPDRSAGPGSKILFALRGAGAVPEILHCKAGQVVEEWILSGTGALWVQGAPGSGCTTLVAGAIHRALSGANGRFLGALRIEGRPGSRMEEALSEINEFLRQLGIHDLDEVLDQRTSLTAKISILLTVLCRHCVVLWFDDFEHLSASGGADAGLPLRYFAQGWAEIPSGAGKVIVVTENGGPDGLLLETTGAQRMSVQETGGVAVEELLGHLEKSVPLGRWEPGT